MVGRKRHLDASSIEQECPASHTLHSKKVKSGSKESDEVAVEISSSIPAPASQPYRSGVKPARATKRRLAHGDSSDPLNLKRIRPDSSRECPIVPPRSLDVKDPLNLLNGKGSRRQKRIYSARGSSISREDGAKSAPYGQGNKPIVHRGVDENPEGQGCSQCTSHNSQTLNKADDNEARLAKKQAALER